MPANTFESTDMSSYNTMDLGMVYVSNIHQRIPQDKLLQILKVCGSVVKWDPSTCAVRGFCTFQTNEAALRCISLLDGYMMYGTPLSVTMDQQTKDSLSKQGSVQEIDRVKELSDWRKDREVIENIMTELYKRDYSADNMPRARRDSCSSLSSSDSVSSSCSSSESVSSPDSSSPSPPPSYHVKSCAPPPYEASLYQATSGPTPSPPPHEQHDTRGECTITRCSPSDIRAVEHRMNLIHGPDDMTQKELLRHFNKLNIHDDSVKAHGPITGVATDFTQDNNTCDNTVRARAPPGGVATNFVQDTGIFTEHIDAENLQFACLNNVLENDRKFIDELYEAFVKEPASTVKRSASEVDDGMYNPLKYMQPNAPCVENPPVFSTPPATPPDCTSTVCTSTLTTQDTATASFSTICTIASVMPDSPESISTQEGALSPRSTDPYSSPRHSQQSTSSQMSADSNEGTGTVAEAEQAIQDRLMELHNRKQEHVIKFDDGRMMTVTDPALLQTTGMVTLAEPEDSNACSSQEQGNFGNTLEHQQPKTYHAMSPPYCGAMHQPIRSPDASSNRTRTDSTDSRHSNNTDYESVVAKSVPVPISVTSVQQMQPSSGGSVYVHSEALNACQTIDQAQIAALLNPTQQAQTMLNSAEHQQLPTSNSNKPASQQQFPQQQLDVSQLAAQTVNPVYPTSNYGPGYQAHPLVQSEELRPSGSQEQHPWTTAHPQPSQQLPQVIPSQQQAAAFPPSHPRTQHQQLHQSHQRQTNAQMQLVQHVPPGNNKQTFESIPPQQPLASQRQAHIPQHWCSQPQQQGMTGHPQASRQTVISQQPFIPQPPVNNPAQLQQQPRILIPVTTDGVSGAIAVAPAVFIPPGSTTRAQRQLTPILPRPPAPVDLPSSSAKQTSQPQTQHQTNPQDVMTPWFPPCDKQELLKCQAKFALYPITTLNGVKEGDEDKDTWLQIVVGKGMTCYIQALLERFKRENCLEDAIDKWNMHHQTSLLSAVQVLNPTTVRTLITHGADPNIQGPKETQDREQRMHHLSPLQWAVKQVTCHPNEALKCVDQILESPKLKINDLSNQGLSALHYAMELYKDAHGNEVSRNIIRKLIQRLLDRGADLNLPSNGTADTPFHILISSGDVAYISETLQKLHIDKQREVATQKNRNNNGCLHMACCLKPTVVTADQLRALVKILVSLGANPKENNLENQKPARYLHTSYKKEISDALKRRVRSSTS